MIDISKLPADKYWNGMHLDTWAPLQTLNPPAEKILMYSGYDKLSYFDDVGLPRIPLDIRFRNFASRLERAKIRRVQQ